MQVKAELAALQEWQRGAVAEMHTGVQNALQVATLDTILCTSGGHGSVRMMVTLCIGGESHFCGCNTLLLGALVGAYPGVCWVPW